MKRRKNPNTKVIPNSNIFSIIDPSVKLGNTVIRGTFYTESDLAIKAFFVLLYQLQKDPNEKLEATLSLKSFYEMMDIPDKWTSGTYVYKWLKMICLELLNIKVMGFARNEGGAFNVFDKAFYKDGKFTAVFAPTMGNYILGAMNQYTTLQMMYLLRFNTKRYVSTALLYGYFRSYAFSIQEETGYATFHLTVEELKKHAGLTNLTGIDTISENKSVTYNDLRRRYLEPAMKQINDLTDIRVEHEPCYGGVGGRVSGVTFRVSWQSDLRLYGATKEEEEKLIGEFGDRFSIEQLVALYVAAKKDIAMISRNIEKLDKKVFCKTVKFEEGTSSYFVYLKNMIESDANNTGDEVVTAKEQISAGKKSSNTRKISQNPKKTLD